MKSEKSSSHISRDMLLWCLFTVLLAGAQQNFVFAGAEILQQKIFYDLKGQRHALAEYINKGASKGKWLVVMIWANECHVCNREVKQYMDFHTRNKKSTAVVLGISINGWSGRDKARSFIRRHKVNFNNILIEPQDLNGFYQALTGRQFRGTPTILMFARDGEFKGHQAGAVPTALIAKYIKNNDGK